MVILEEAELIQSGLEASERRKISSFSGEGMNERICRVSVFQLGALTRFQVAAYVTNSKGAGLHKTLGCIYISPTPRRHTDTLSERVGSLKKLIRSDSRRTSIFMTAVDENSRHATGIPVD